MAAPPRSRLAKVACAWLLLVCCLASTGDWLPLVTRTQLSPATLATRCLHHEQTIAIVTQSPDSSVSGCRLVLAEGDARLDKAQLLQHYALQMPVASISFSEMIDIISACKQFHSEVNITTTDDEEKIDSYSSLTRGILPGTLWCGVNDIADDYSHLGQLWRLDTCCRQHDFCPVKVKPLQSRQGLFNLSPYTKSHCSCDTIFYDCLKTVNSSESRAVGHFFFNVIGVECVEERLSRQCVREQRSVGGQQKVLDQDVPMESEQRSLIIPGLALGLKGPSQTSCAKFATKSNLVGMKRKRRF